MVTTNTELTSAARTATGQSAGSGFPSQFMEMNIYINVTVVSGTSPSMTITYQTSPDGITWYDHTAGAAITAVSTQLLKIAANAGGFGRLNYAITGTTPSFTFSAIFEGKGSAN